MLFCHNQDIVFAVCKNRSLLLEAQSDISFQLSLGIWMFEYIQTTYMELCDQVQGQIGMNS